MQTVPRTGNMPRCVHGHYIAKHDRIAYYCRLCHADGEPKNTKPVVLPHFSCDPLNEKDRLHANSHNPNNCRSCGSTIYIQINSTKIRCADCGTERGTTR